jgi:hypothetical protein
MGEDLGGGAGGRGFTIAPLLQRLLRPGRGRHRAGLEPLFGGREAEVEAEVVGDDGAVGASPVDHLRIEQGMDCHMYNEI